MTLIQPEKQNTMLKMMLLALVGLLICGGIILVFLYNRLVNLDHSVSARAAEVRQLEVQNAELKDQIFALFSTRAIEEVAASRGLIQDRAPEYFELPGTWDIASRY